MTGDPAFSFDPVPSTKVYNFSYADTVKGHTHRVLPQIQLAPQVPRPAPQVPTPAPQVPTPVLQALPQVQPAPQVPTSEPQAPTPAIQLPKLKVKISKLFIQSKQNL